VKKYTTDKIRNIAFYGHGGSGKTSMAEAMLFNTGVLDRMGKVEDGNTAMDFDDEEKKRGMSIYTSLAPCQWKEYKINCLDVPGFLDFVGEIKSSISVIEGAILFASANSGLEVGLERVWDEIETRKLPSILVVNKMDKENADYYKVIQSIREKLSPSFHPIHLPIGSSETYSGYVDIVTMTAYKYENGKAVKIDIPADMSDKIEEYRSALVESAAEGDDELLEKYLETMELTDEEVVRGLKEAVKAGKVIPVISASATKNIAVDALMNAVIDLIPSPAEVPVPMGINPASGDAVEVNIDSPFSAFVFKTTADPYVGKLTFLRIYSGSFAGNRAVYNPNKDKEEKVAGLLTIRGKNQENTDEVAAGDIVTVAKLVYTVTGDTLCTKESPVMYPAIEFPPTAISMAIFPKSKGDEDKLGTGLAKISDEDPTFKVMRDTETKETVVSGMGELHLDIAKCKMKKKFGIDVELSYPRISYKETIKKKAHVDSKHKKQSGGKGQYGHCVLDIEPLERGKYFEFIDKIVGGAIPRNFIPSIEKGIRKTMEEGAIAGYPIVDISISVVDGSYHPVDSSDMAFQIAGSKGLKEGMKTANPCLLEPINNVEVTVPDQYMGDVIGDINAKRGRIMGMEPIGKKGLQLVKAQVPLAEMQKYAIDLRSMTQGRGVYVMNFDHYEEVPAQIAEGIIAEYEKNKKEE